MPLTQQQDVRRLDAFECFEEEPLGEAQEGVERVVGGDLLRGGGWKETQKVEAGTVELEVSWNLKHKPVPQAVSPEQALHTLQGAEQVEQPQVEEETVSGEGSWPEPPLQWELWVPLPQEEGQVCTRRSGDLAGDDLPQLRKSEPVYTPDIELLLDALQEPLSVVHTVDAERNYVKWMPAIHKEVGVIEKAVQRLAPEKVKEGGWLKRKEVKVVPSKLVFTVKPPDPPAEGVTPHAVQQSQASTNPVPHAAREGQATHKRKARLVACGNHAPSTGSEVYASGAAAETLRCFVVLCSKRCWWLGSLDVTSPLSLKATAFPCSLSCHQGCW